MQGIVRGHHGAILLESTRGVGTSFSVLLPRAPMAYQDPPRTPAATPVRLGTTVLVVDDEPKVRKVVGEILEHAGYQVLRAVDGQEALEVFRREADTIDCVLLDLSMPKLDGEEVFRAMRAIRPSVPVVLCSGFTEQEILDRFHGAGLAGVLQKPAQMQVVLERVAAATSRAPV